MAAPATLGAVLDIDVDDTLSSNVWNCTLGDRRRKDTARA